MIAATNIWKERIGRTFARNGSLRANYRTATIRNPRRAQKGVGDGGGSGGWLALYVRLSGSDVVIGSAHKKTGAAQKAHALLRARLVECD